MRLDIPARILALALLCATLRADFVVQGFVTNPDGTVPHAYVQVMDEDPGPDEILADTFADANGFYSVLVTSPTDEDPDVYARFDWRFEVTAIPATIPPTRFIEVLGTSGTGVCPTDATFVAFTPVNTPVTVDYASTAPLTKDVMSLQGIGVSSWIDLLLLHLNLTVEYYELHKGSVAWSLQHDIKVVIVNDFFHQSFCPTNQAVYLSIDTILGPPIGSSSVIYHEVGHMLHWFANGMSLPGPAVNPHTFDVETNVGAALVEAWAAYTANKTDIELNPTPDGFFDIYRDVGLTHWRGDETMPTGYDMGTWESGEVVEGAVSGVLHGLHVLFDFDDSWRVIVDDHPSSIYAFLQGFAADHGGPGTPDTLSTYVSAQQHGILFTRARFASPPFYSVGPPDVAPPHVGNAVVIDDVTFLRGIVQGAVEAVSAGDLGVATPIGLAEVQVEYKPAVAGTGEVAFGFTAFPADVFDGDIEIPTLAFGGPTGDGDWDLALRGASTYFSPDTFDPSWAGDGTAAVNTDERYLKTLGTWFDADRDPTTPSGHPDDGGKVVVDNTPPTLSNFNL